MLCKQPTLIEVLQPPHFEGNPARAKVTRTIRQPDMDEFELRAAQAAENSRGKCGGSPGPASRGSGTRATTKKG